jgi:hypothetical protein
MCSNEEFLFQCRITFFKTRLMILLRNAPDESLGVPYVDRFSLSCAEFRR